jgi:hypothetical protein
MCLVTARVRGNPLDSASFGGEDGGEARVAQQVNKLSARTVQTLATPGRHSDGGGLYLSVSEKGARSWVFMWKFGNRRREMGLGPLVTCLWPKHGNWPATRERSFRLAKTQ